MSTYPKSLGQATNSLADTAARHHIVGKLCAPFYQSITDPNAVINNQGDFVAVKDEIALAIGRAYNDKLGLSVSDGNKGNPPVITNIGPFCNGSEDDLMTWYIKFFDCRSAAERDAHAFTSCKVRNQTFYPPELYFGGFIINHNAQAHPINGDPAVTLFIGGIMTIKNGRFPVDGGAMVQWYFDEEADAGLFDPTTGKRVPRSANVQPQPLDRDAFRVKTHSYAERAFTKRIAYVKACVPGLDGKGCTIGDLRRVFGIATHSAGPWEKIDIKVSRQSL